jgi:hypothetical protein
MRGKGDTYTYTFVMGGGQDVVPAAAAVVGAVGPIRGGNNHLRISNLTSTQFFFPAAAAEVRFVSVVRKYEQVIGNEYY